MNDASKTTHGSKELDEDAAKLKALGADAGPSFLLVGDPRKCWLGDLKAAIEALRGVAPDETCRAIADQLLQETYEWGEGDA